MSMQTAESNATTSTWEIDAAHSSAQFSVKHMMVSTVKGHFAGVSGTITLDEKDITKSKVDVKIDASTVDTRDEKRDAHLRSADFFEVEKYPEITFKSTKVTKKGDGLTVEGELALHGVTKSVTLEVEGPTPAYKNPWGALVRGASAEAKINRKDWNLAFNMPLEGVVGGVLVGEDVKIHIDVELTKKG